MKEQHIINVIEGAPLGSLSAGELESVRAHAARCEECRRAFEAARVSAEMLRARAAEEFEPSPFFQTRVLAALRARRAEEEAPMLARLWRAAGALASSMAATVALLAGLTFVVPTAGVADEEEVAAASEPYSAEAALLGASAGDEEMDYEQVLSAIYASGVSDE
jgi:predicted anti-sigma-YlaC factor YlaD